MCTLAAAQGKDSTDPGKLQSTNTHRGHTGLPLLPLLPPFFSITPIPSASCQLSQHCTQHYQNCWGCEQPDRHLSQACDDKLQEVASLSSCLRMPVFGQRWTQMICLSLLCLCLILPRESNTRRAPKIPRCPATCSCTKDSAFCVDSKVIPKSFPPGIISLWVQNVFS